jgi:hypothetical protein
LLPLLAFMLIPIWIPMIAVALGAAASRSSISRVAVRGRQS